jgi:hypothetical protein
MESIWYWIISLSIVAIFNIVGFSYGVDCSNKNNYNNGGKTYMSILLAINVLVLVCAIMNGVYIVYD